ncbi:MAG: choice-of-anchor R domain-containing protein, partial [Snowella sp.]
MKIQSQLLLLGFTSTLVWGVSIAPSSAVNFIGNVPTDDGSSSILSSTSGSNIKAVSFTQGSGPDYSLDDVVLRLGNYDTSDSFSVEIRNNAGTNPGSTVLASLSLAPGETPQGSTNAYYRFIPNSSFTFQPSNDTYWLYLSIAASSGNSG